MFKNFRPNKILVFFSMLVIAMIGFELFNFATTRAALTSFFPSQMFLGISWAALLAVSACLVDFAGIAKIITPERGKQEPMYVWALLAGWAMSAIINAALTWWGTVMALVAIPDLGNEVVTRVQLVQVVPLGVALFVVLIRVSLIGTIMASGEEVFHSKRNATMPLFASRKAPAASSVPNRSNTMSPLKRPVAKTPEPVLMPGDNHKTFDLESFLGKD